MADILSTLTSLQGPEVLWGAAGSPLGYQVTDVKGNDNFGRFVAAIEETGVMPRLEGEFTVLAPSDSAFEKYLASGGKITADVIAYHFIPGRKSLDMLAADQPTLQGGTLTSYRKFRKNWLDNSIIGLKSEGASKSSNWPADVATDRGMIHAIDTVLVPGAYTGSR